jgi:hypothetical protein
VTPRLLGGPRSSDRAVATGRHSNLRLEYVLLAHLAIPVPGGTQ